MSEKDFYTLSVNLPKELIKKLSTEIVYKYGRTYGNMIKAVKEALEYWINAQKLEREKVVLN